MQINIDDSIVPLIETLTGGSAEEAVMILVQTAAEGVANPESWQSGWNTAAGLQPTSQAAVLDGIWLQSERERLGISRNKLAIELQVVANQITLTERAVRPVPPVWLPRLRRLGFRLAPHGMRALDQEQYTVLFSSLKRATHLSPLHPTGDGTTYTCAFCDVVAALPASHDARHFPHAHCFWLEAQKLNPKGEA